MTPRWFYQGERGFIEYHLQNFDDLFRVMSEAMQRQARVLEAEIQRAAEAIPEEERDLALEPQRLQLYDLQGPFLDHIRAYNLISLYSYFEHELISLCREIQRNRVLLVGVDDLKGKGIFLAKNYLTKVARHPFPSDGVEWQELQRLNRIRNAIVHNRGIIEDRPDNRDIREYIGRTPGLELADQKLVRVDDVYLTHVVSLLKSFFDKLYPLPEADHQATTGQPEGLDERSSEG